MFTPISQDGLHRRLTQKPAHLENTTTAANLVQAEESQIAWRATAWGLEGIWSVDLLGSRYFVNKTRVQRIAAVSNSLVGRPPRQLPRCGA